MGSRLGFFGVFSSCSCRASSAFNHSRSRTSFSSHLWNNKFYCFVISGKRQSIWWGKSNKPCSIQSTSNSQNSKNLHRFLNCVNIKYFQKSVQLAAPKYCLDIYQIFWKKWWVQNFQIFVRKFLRTWIILDRITLGLNICHG